MWMLNLILNRLSNWNHQKKINEEIKESNQIIKNQEIDTLEPKITPEPVFNCCCSSQGAKKNISQFLSNKERSF